MPEVETVFAVWETEVQEPVIQDEPAEDEVLSGIEEVGQEGGE